MPVAVSLVGVAAEFGRLVWWWFVEVVDLAERDVACRGSRRVHAP
ncbi:hypothetical protein [Pseudofrankia sp. BMG5.37]|nr:hypothetical protein [Pseudofrankia sp. BMG5.37]MDT3442695.1 hypothetical protein [Pseudofrankia sp. BMG5.37]